MSEMSLPHLTPYTYSESTGNRANPLAEMYLSETDVTTIESIAYQIDMRRQELAAENPSQRFAGIVTNKEGPNMLLVIDSNTTGAPYNGRQYVVRTSPLTGDKAGQITEEYIPDDPDHRTYYRSPVQMIQTSVLGAVGVGVAHPDPRFEPRESSQNVPFAAIGDTGRVVSLDDALRQPTHAELVRAARNALDIGQHAGRYPNIDNQPIKIDGRWERSSRRTSVERTLRFIATALGSQELTPQDRERLVNLGHEIMDTANQSPENVHRGAVLDSEEAAHMAHAEEQHRQKPNGLLGRHRHRNLQAASSAAYEASWEYQRSLHQSRT